MSFFVDSLLVHAEQVRYVVVELKVGKFGPEFAGQLAFYVTLVEEQLRHPDRYAPTVGILLCSGSNESVVRDALRSTDAPMAIATTPSTRCRQLNRQLPCGSNHCRVHRVAEPAEVNQIDARAASPIIDDAD